MFFLLNLYLNKTNGYKNKLTQFSKAIIMKFSISDYNCTTRYVERLWICNIVLIRPMRAIILTIFNLYKHFFSGNKRNQIRNKNHPPLD